MVDLNADVGESFGAWTLGDDDALLQVVTSANVACGAYAGDPTTMRRTCATAARAGVRVGAQVGYRDLAGFGRRFVDVAPEELVDDVLAQLGALSAFARVAGTRVAFVKPHGALYHAVTAHEGQAAAVVEAVRLFDPTLPLVGAPGALSLALASAAGLPVLREGFADRLYTPSGGLIGRREPGAVLTDPATAAAQAVSIAHDGSVTASDGSTVALEVDTLCVHGDSPGAAALARAVRDALEAAGLTVAA